MSTLERDLKRQQQQNSTLATAHARLLLKNERQAAFIGAYDKWAHTDGGSEAEGDAFHEMVEAREKLERSK